MEREAGNDEFILRDAHPDDVPRVAELLRASYAEHARSFPPALWHTYRREIAAVSERLAGADLIVAVLADRLIGSVTLYRGDGHDRDWPPGVASLRLLAVEPAVRARGIGSALVRECVQRSRRRGCTHLGLHTAPFMTAAVRLYERLGFVRVPDRDFDAHARYSSTRTGTSPSILKTSGPATSGRRMTGSGPHVIGLAYCKDLRRAETG